MRNQRRSAHLTHKGHAAASGGSRLVLAGVPVLLINIHGLEQVQFEVFQAPILSEKEGDNTAHAEVIVKLSAEGVMDLDSQLKWLPGAATFFCEPFLQHRDSQCSSAGGHVPHLET